tara:strand:+ start:128 stop:496 length:369 start_codon:yes stop_codon:yes gene_type:complete
MNFKNVGTLSSALAISLGALGAHKLEPQLLANGTLEAWKTAALYHLVHSVALYFLAALQLRDPDRFALMAMWLWFGGILLFSGSLYGLALTQWPVLGPITPLGGLSFIAGWIILLFSRSKSA